MEFTLERIMKVQESNVWSFGNQVLYDMCQKAPLHINEDEIIGKVWLIGRSYAAAIERGAKSARNNDQFYENRIAVKMKVAGKELDERIARLTVQTQITKEILKDVVETHCFLTKVFHDIFGMDKRSLASKYLHFHVPNLFYIYDSRAIKGVTEFHSLDKKLRKDLMNYDCDKTYADFISKVYPLNVKKFEKHGIWLTPRQIDALLLGYS